jgi:pyrophosphatase PpaX
VPTPEPPWDVVLFDLDGTLIDSIPLIRESLRYTLKAHGRDVPPDDVLMSSVGRPLEDTLARWARDAEETTAMALTYRDYNLAVHDDWVRLIEGIDGIVEALHEGGARLGVVTSKRSDGAHKGLAVTGLARWFPVLVAADHVTRGKPDREPIDRALAALDAPAGARAVYIGDATHDIEAAHAAGIDAIAVTWGVGSAAQLAATQPAHLVASTDALRGLLLPAS